MCHSKLRRKEKKLYSLIYSVKEKKKAYGNIFLSVLCVFLCVLFPAFDENSCKPHVIAVNTFFYNSPTKSINNMV